MKKKKIHIRAANMRRPEKSLEVYDASMTLCRLIDRTGNNKFLITEDPKKVTCLRCMKYLVNPSKKAKVTKKLLELQKEYIKYLFGDEVLNEILNQRSKICK